MTKADLQKKLDEKWDDEAKDVLIVAGAAIVKPPELGDTFIGIYLGKVRRQSDFGGVWMHLYQVADGMCGMWGFHALDEGMGRCELGHETRIDGKGEMKLDKGKTMRLIRVRQLGAFIDSCSLVTEAQTDAVYEALGYPKGAPIEVNDETGEVVSGKVFADLQA